MWQFSETAHNIYDEITHTQFDYSSMDKKSTLMAIIQQYSPELLALLGELNISDKNGF